MKEIYLTQGKVAIVDDEDFDLASQYKWFVRKGSNTFYASTWVGEWKTRKLLHLHRLIMKNPDSSVMVDHKDRDGLNNQKSNLRLCTNTENSKNRRPKGSSKFLGVSIVNGKKNKYWRAFISVDGKNKYLGFFKSEDDAAWAYNKAALEYHGEFANLNQI
jgi:hypothetical protein